MAGGGSSGLAVSRVCALAVPWLAILAVACAGAQQGASISVSETPLGEQGQLIHGLGVAAAGGSVAAVLPVGCELPCDGTFSVRTTRQDQKRITLKFYTLARHAAPIGGVQIVGLPAGPAGEYGVEVKIRATKDRLIVNADEKESGAALEVRTLLDFGP